MLLERHCHGVESKTFIFRIARSQNRRPFNLNNKSHLYEKNARLYIYLEGPTFFAKVSGIIEIDVKTSADLSHVLSALLMQAHRSSMLASNQHYRTSVHMPGTENIIDQSNQ
jgi:hypothetical protein